MKETFVTLCNLWFSMSYYLWLGNCEKAEHFSKQIDEIAKNHKVLNFFASHMYPFFV